MKKKILIAGAGIAGPVLAYWFSHYGNEVTIIEKATDLRTGGYSIDVRGAAVEVLKKMGLHGRIQKLTSDIDTAVFVDGDGKPLVSLPADVMEMQSEGDLELMRGELSEILFNATKEKCRYIFGVSITGLKQNDQGVEVSFSNGQVDFFDIVVGADGMHSSVRKLVFGNEAQFSHSYGDYYFAFFSTSDQRLGTTEYFHCVPGRTTNIYSPKYSGQSKALFIFNETGFENKRANAEDQKNQVANLFEGIRWKVPELLREMAHADDLYIDNIKQIRMERWFDKNIVLTGDAAYAPSLATGQGTSMAIVGSYVLARELNKAKGDTSIAFPAYQQALKKYVELNQKMGKNVKNMVGKSEKSLKMQFKFLRIFSKIPVMMNMMKKGMAKAANAVDI